MTGRIWVGKVLLINKNEFVEYIKQTGLPGLKETAGNLGVQIFIKDFETFSQIMIISFWDSIESIMNFTGPDFTVARLYPDDQKYLIDMEPVVHYEVLIKDC